MSDIDTEKKLQQFEEFFSIDAFFNTNITPLNSEDKLSFDAFLDTVPLPFKMATDIMILDQAALKPLHGLNGVADQLVEFLNFQTQKIDLLMGFMLSQQDDEKHRYQGIKFGGGGIVFNSVTSFSLNQLLEIKVFLKHENAALFCHGEVVEIEKIADSYQHKIIFSHIRDEDREILVRGSLHLQSKQLKTLAKKRNRASL
jgi:hypothetical protein